MATYTDEECIAKAMLHGCTFYEAPLGDATKPSWYVDDRRKAPYHPLEEYMAANNQHFFRAGGGWPSMGALARDYCEFYGLLL